MLIVATSKYLSITLSFFIIKKSIILVASFYALHYNINILADIDLPRKTRLLIIYLLVIIKKLFLCVLALVVL